MKTILAAATVLLLQTQSHSTNGKKPTDFPESDLYHVGCKLIAQFDTLSCTEFYGRMFSIIKAFSIEDPQKGHYKVRENVDQNYIWSNRTLEKHDMIDDTLFEFKQTQQGCKVRGRSISQSVQFYDFETNYCNIWNVMYFAEGPLFRIQEDEDCQWKPKDPPTHCVRPNNQTTSENQEVIVNTDAVNSSATQPETNENTQSNENYQDQQNQGIETNYEQQNSVEESSTQCSDSQQSQPAENNQDELSVVAL